MNRKIITLLFTMAITVAFTARTVAGNYFPTGMTWKEVLAEPGYAQLDTTYSFLYEIGGDTIVNGVTCKEVLLNNIPIQLWLYEDGSKVWLLTEDYPEPIMIYDFDWHGENPAYCEYYLIGENSLTKERDYINHADIQNTWLAGRQVEYVMKDTGAIVNGIGRVTELYRNCCLLGYNIEEPILPGLIYSKVLWIVRDGKEVFRSENAEEWITDIPTDGYSTYDLNGDGLVDVDDVNALINAILSQQ